MLAHHPSGMLRKLAHNELLGLALGVVGIADVSRGVWVSRSSEGMTGGRASPAGQGRVDQSRTTWLQT